MGETGIDGEDVPPSDFVTGADPATMGAWKGEVVLGDVTGAIVTGGGPIGDVAGAMVRSFRQ